MVAWSLQREARRERQRREEEHLAFSGMLANGIAHDFRNPMSAMRLAENRGAGNQILPLEALCAALALNREWKLLLDTDFSPE